MKSLKESKSALSLNFKDAILTDKELVVVKGGWAWGFLAGYFGSKLIDGIIEDPGQFGDQGNGVYGHMGGARP